MSGEIVRAVGRVELKHRLRSEHVRVRGSGSVRASAGALEMEAIGPDR